MLNKHRAFVQILKELCDEQNISMVPLCFDWVFRLEKEGRVKNVFGYDLGINSSVAQKISLDKAATYEILKSAGIDAVEHELFLEPGCDYLAKSGNWERVYEYFKAYEKIVCKPNTGQGGKEVFLIIDENELEKVIHQLFIRNRAIALSPFYEIKNEFRIVVLDHEVLLVFRKIRQNGEWKHNLSNGATPEIVDDISIKEQLVEIALNAVSAIGIVFAAVDIIETEEGYKVLEVNSGISLDYFVKHDGFDRAKKIYEKALARLF